MDRRHGREATPSSSKSVSTKSTAIKCVDSVHLHISHGLLITLLEANDVKLRPKDSLPDQDRGPDRGQYSDKDAGFPESSRDQELESEILPVLVSTESNVSFLEHDITAQVLSNLYLLDEASGSTSSDNPESNTTAVLRYDLPQPFMY